MKKLIYFIIIVILAVYLIFTLFKLNEKEDTQNKVVNQPSQTTNSIKEHKNTNLSEYSPNKEFDKKVIDEKVNKLNEELEKTKQMLRIYNEKNPNKPIETKDLDEVLNLDINKEVNTNQSNKTKIENKEVLKLQKEIDQIKNSIKNIKE